jgi:hypothetical protein
MSLTVDLKPDVQAALARQAAAQGRALEAYAAILLEEAARVPPQQLRRRTGQELIDASAKVRGLLTDEEVDTLFIPGEVVPPLWLSGTGQSSLPGLFLPCSGAYGKAPYHMLQHKCN